MTAVGEALPAYFLFGIETEPPPNSQQSFLANWWFTGPRGQMKQSTSFPVISFGTAAVAVYTSNASLLGNLIGGNTDANFLHLKRSWGLLYGHNDCHGETRWREINTFVCGPPDGCFDGGF